MLKSYAINLQWSPADLTGVLPNKNMLQRSITQNLFHLLVNPVVNL